MCVCLCVYPAVLISFFIIEVISYIVRKANLVFCVECTKFLGISLHIN